MWAPVGQANLAAAGLPAGWDPLESGSAGCNPAPQRLGQQTFGRRHAVVRDGSTKYVAEREFYMGFALSVVGGLFLVGYAFSRMNARKGSKKNVQTIFDTK
jgi:hypothetical protein